MFYIKIDDIDPFLDATTLFAELTHDEICLKFSLSTFLIIVRYQTGRLFFATMSMPLPLFTEYSVDRDHISRVSLRSLHNALVQGEIFASLTIHLQEDKNTILLTFEPSSSSTLLPLNRELKFMAMEEVFPGEVKLDGKIFSIEAELFRDLITLFSVHKDVDTILITSVGSKVTFSVLPIEEAPLTEESEACLILGDREIESQIKMPLHPSSFFINCVFEARRVWFFQSTDPSYAIIHFPFQVYPHFFMLRVPLEM